ncbi:MAG: hypothetical protein J5552_03820 [Prevotella sp.]|nr:hypothetical protein [Prevotella sp.]
MKQTIFSFMMLIALVACTTKNKPATAVENQEESSEASPDTLKHLSPVAIWEMPNISREEYENNMNEMDEDETDSDDSSPDYSLYDAMYSSYCSWYCGGYVDTLTASSCHRPEGGHTYEAAHAHDFDHESVWATEGKGIGEWLTFRFAGNCPRITSVGILNGHVKNEKSWRNNSRIKTMLMYYNGVPYRILDLEDSRTMQWFDVDTLGYEPMSENAEAWRLKFEIREVYRGEKYDDAVISDFLFDGIDVH